MVVDTSVLLAILFEEPTNAACIECLKAATSPVRISPVNWTETLILVRSRRPASAPELERTLRGLPLWVGFAGQRDAEIAARARLRYPLNLGDCFAYALAKTRGEPLLTLDSDFAGVDVEVIFPHIA